MKKRCQLISNERPGLLLWINGFVLDRTAKVTDSFKIYDPDKNRMIIKKMPFKRYKKDGDMRLI